MMTIWFASGNVHKKKELSDILNIDLKIPFEAGLVFEPEETGNTFFENALLKAEELYRLLSSQEKKDVWRHGDAIIADDSGICVDALGGRPGIHSARYCGLQPGGKLAGGKTLGADEKNRLLLAELGENTLRSGRFVCAMVLYFGPTRFFAAQETMEGLLVKNMEESRGQGGFGYDPILFIPELGKTVAELTDEEKNRHSHRGKAGKAIAKILSND